MNNGRVACSASCLFSPHFADFSSKLPIGGAITTDISDAVEVHSPYFCSQHVAGGRQVEFRIVM